MPKCLRASMGVVDTSTSQGRNVCIRYSFEAHDNSLERSIRGVHISFNPYDDFDYRLGFPLPKKHHLGPQNNPESSGPKNL